MPNHTFHAEEWFYWIENQTNPKLPNRLELLPGLRARFGNLLREDIVSVALVSDGQTNLVVISALGQPLITLPIDHHLPTDLLSWSDTVELRNLLPIAGEWVNALDGFEAAREFELFSPHALALIERISSQSVDLSELEKAEKAQVFYLALAQEMAKEYAPAIREKIESAVRKKYHSRPDNNMVGDECETEWQELGAMLLDGTHLLLEIGIHQLQLTIAGEITKLSRQDRLALWFGNCKYIADVVCDHTPDDTFDLMEDSYALEEIVESIASDLQTEMVWDWEKKLSELEADWQNDDEESNV